MPRRVSDGFGDPFQEKARGSRKTSFQPVPAPARSLRNLVVIVALFLLCVAAAMVQHC
jgi:hypothetical protein